VSAESRRPEEATGSQKSIAADSPMLPLTGIDKAIRNASAWDRSNWDAALRDFAATGQPFTIEQMVERTGLPIDHPNRIGALTAAAAKAGVIRRIGYTQARRASRACGVVAVWVGAEMTQ
jgi:hypothetical protein